MRLQFLGAARMVTGSCYLLEIAKRKILVDCGMFQGSKAIRAMNYRNFAFQPSEIDCVLLTHAHVDHCGLIPKLCKLGFKGKIYSTKVTKELCQIMLPDSAHIQEFDAEISNRKGQRAGKKPIEPIYTMDDALASLEQFAAVAYDQDFVVNDEVTVRFRDAGHIIGSAILEVFVKENGKETKLLFSGDLGQSNQPIIKDPTIINGADYIIVESTYGNRVHEFYEKENYLAEVINDTIERGGNVVIPAFAVGRTQTMLYYLYKLWRAGKIPDIPVILDSPLAIAATKIFAKNTQEFDEESQGQLNTDGSLPQMPQLIISQTAEESKAINSRDGSAIILSASGMADSGRILHHLKHNLWRPESSILFVGFQAQESMGRRLTDGIKRVKIMGEELRVKAKIYNLEGFSAHADRHQIIDWLAKVGNPKPANIFFVHGESLAAGSLSEAVVEQLSVSTYIPHFGDIAVIEGRSYSIEETKLAIEPAAKDLEDFLSLVESDYRQIRKQLINSVMREPSRLPDTTKKITKALKYLKKLLSE